jgi:hypothetical protein
MNNDPHQPHRRVRTGIELAGAASFAALVAMIGNGLERVHTGRPPGTFRSVWLVEVNWIAFAICITVLVLALMAGLWLRYRQWRQVREARAMSADG